MKILLIEDHDRLAHFLCKGLRDAQLAVDRFAHGGDGLSALECGHYDATILDLGLPDGDGLEVLRTLRTRGQRIPVLILTARVQVADRVAGLDAGADDYLTKPFAMEELLARLRALLRRPGESMDPVLSAGNLTFDAGSRQASVNGAPIALSPRETGLLEQLIRRGGKVVRKTLLEDGLYDMADDLSSNSVEVLVHRLRKKLAEAGTDVAIHTVRGVGYMLDGGA